MSLTSSFQSIGAKVRIRESSAPSDRSALWREDAPIVIDIRDDGAGEYFKLTHRPDVAVDVQDVQVNDRHLLLTARIPDRAGATRRANFLCGRDEKHWFVAAIPEKPRVRSVQSAKDALKPKAVWDALRAHNVPAEHRDRRRTAAFIRQGEWFFIPRPHLKVARAAILHNEPIRRGAGKPHLCQFLTRSRGTRVYVRYDHPNGITEEEFRKLNSPYGWREMVRDAKAFVKGNIRHPDHKTVWLSHWHEVVMNTEAEAEAMKHVAFLD
jgi:hypothetical protein